jgi:membrane protease YdiL (CAAX protease family)
MDDNRHSWNIIPAVLVAIEKDGCNGCGMRRPRSRHIIPKPLGSVGQDRMTTDTTTRPSFVHRYPIVSFYILALALGAGTVYLVVQGIIPAGVALASALSASIAGIIMTAVEDGRAGLKLILSRLLIWRVGIGYWLFATLFLVPAILLGSVVNPLFNGDPLSFNNMKSALEILPMFISFFIVAGLGQELGWTGFLTPRLQAHFGALTSCVMRAILVGIWHLPLLLYSRLQLPALADFPYSGWIAQKGLPVAIVTLILMFLLPWSIFCGWIFNNTRGGLLLVAVLHGSEVWVAYWMLSAGIDPGNLDNYWGYGAVMIVIAIIIVITTGSQNLSRKRKRIVHQPSPG